MNFEKGRRKTAPVAALLLLFTMACDGWLDAQARGLKIVVIEGEGAINNIQTGSARNPVVEVRDENDRPVAGARLKFSLPERGPGGSFFGAGSNLTVVSNREGRASTAGFRPNLTRGRFQIRVDATEGDRAATVNITQSNILPADSGTTIKPDRKFGKRKIIGALAVGAIIGAVIATRGGDETPATTVPGTSIT